MLADAHAHQARWGYLGAAGPERSVAISDIEVGDRLRRLDEGFVADLAVSIAETGLIQPIVVRAVEDAEAYRLLAGAHRLAAHRRLGRDTIQARVVTVSDLDAMQFEIDENIIRAAPGGLEFFSFIGERMEIFAQRHPDQVAFEPKGEKRGRGRPPKNFAALRKIPGGRIRTLMGFAEEVAGETGLSRRTIYQAAQAWAALQDHDAQLRDLPIARSAKALLTLAKAPPELLGAAIELLAAGEAETAADALVIADGGVPAARRNVPQTTVDQELKALKTAWKRARPTTREAFIDFLMGAPLPKGVRITRDA